jgi:hypothetical protein
MKKRKFQDGGDVDDKLRGLKASEGEKVGFLKRLRMGNIDDPTSEAYKQFGAGRGATVVRGNTEDDAASLEKTGGFGKAAVAEAAKRPTYRAITEGQVDERDRRQEAQASMPKKQSFGQAFAAARKAGDKTFMFGGKKYTTELAKPAAKKDPDVGKGPSKTTIERLERRAAASGMKKGGMVKSSASKRADGIAVKGKTRGKMV